jgi:hypothetical protein
METKAMSDDFDFLQESSNEAEDLPDWLEEAAVAPLPVEEEDESSTEEAFERWRQEANLAASELDDELENRSVDSEGGFFSQLSPMQRLVLAVLLLMNVIIVTLAILIVTGTLAF